MTKRIPQPRTELPPSVRVHEAKLLAAMLRTSRLTWVFDEPGTDKSALLSTGVMQLLQRRRGDGGTGPASAAAPAAAPERRRRQVRPRSEVAIHFDEWGPTPLSALMRRIAGIAPAAAAGAEGATLAQTLRQLHQRLGLHFVFLLDRFEGYLAMEPEGAEVGQFADELIEVIAQDALPASFLIGMDEAARPRLERFRARIPSFDHDMLRLSPVFELRTPSPPAPATQSNRTVHAAQPRRPPPPRAPVRVEDVYALIETTLSRSRAGSRSADLHCDVDLNLSEAALSADQPFVEPCQRSNDKTAGRSNLSDPGESSAPSKTS